MVVGLAATVSPWIARNHMLFGDTETSPRAPLLSTNLPRSIRCPWKKSKGFPTFMARTCTNEPSRGPHSPILGTISNGSGRWQRLNRGALSNREAQYPGRPEKAVSIHRVIAAEGSVFGRQAEESGHAGPVGATEYHVRDQRIRMIPQQPRRHLLMSVPFFWKGFWSFPDVRLPFAPANWQKEIVEIVNLLSGFALFGLFLAGVLRLRLDWVAITLLPIGMLLLHALFTHNIPRYSLPAHPLMLITAILTLSISSRASSMWIRHHAPTLKDSRSRNHTRRP